MKNRNNVRLGQIAKLERIMRIRATRCFHEQYKYEYSVVTTRGICLYCRSILRFEEA